jgi:hypothetical protein
LKLFLAIYSKKQNYTFELYLSDTTTMIIQTEVVDEYVGIALSSQLGVAN